MEKKFHAKFHACFHACFHAWLFKEFQGVPFLVKSSRGGSHARCHVLSLAAVLMCVTLVGLLGGPAAVGEGHRSGREDAPCPEFLGEKIVVRN